MNLMSILAFGVIGAFCFIGYAVDGIVTGRMIAKDYRTINGKRIYSRTYVRAETPIAFWLIVIMYVSVGIIVLAAEIIVYTQR